MAPQKSPRMQNQMLQTNEVLIISDEEDVNTQVSNRRKRKGTSRNTQNNNSNLTREQRTVPPTTTRITGGQTRTARAAHRQRGSAGAARRQPEAARTVRGQTRAARGRTRTSRASTRPKRRAAERPVIVNLDVTYSEPSDVTYSESSDVEEITSKKTATTNKENAESFLNIKNNRCSISDSDEDIMPDFYSKTTTKTEANADLIEDSDSETEIYKVDYKAERWKALEEIKEMMKEKNLTKGKKRNEISEKENKVSKSILSDVDSTPSKEVDLNHSVEGNADNLSANSSLDLNVDVSAVVLSGSAKVVRRTSKKTKNALASLQLFFKKLDKDAKLDPVSIDDYDDDDDIIMANDFKVTFRVCWGTNYTRHVLDRNSTFANFYQEIADKHQVSVSQIVLSFKDSLVTPESCPKDINLSTGDILEGGILQDSDKNYSSQKGTTEGEISLKVQTANRKIVHTVSMSKYDKMSILMEKYSKLRDIPLTKLKFKFDGESLEPTDTPSSLDLEGDECIDVFEL